MRVKRLEVQGFKSFKDKTVIHFDHTITGIVGPNGCGKSNIVDAFFWVMGEQSFKHMRSGGSEDLIFNGSSKYAPLGMAEATLVMETDFDDSNQSTGATTRELPPHLRCKEVSVTRRVYRDGEGEYFINGVPARLKDIQELFMDTGVGAKGYSVIEQGQIGKIVNAKPEDRRLLIEEAAGIAKYKARKKESLRKMEATQANLSRLTDVVQEIERQLDSLERQAQKARLYNKYKAELLDKEMTWGRRKARVIREKLQNLRKTRDILEQELTALRAELQVTENSIEADRINQLTDTKLAEELQAQIQSQSSELTRAQSSLELSRKRQGDLEGQVDAFTRERAELETAIAVERETLTSRETDSQTHEEQLYQAAERVRSKDEEVRSARQRTDASRRKLDEAKRGLMTAVAQSSDLTSRVAALTSRMESALQQVERLSQQVEGYRQKSTQAREEFERTTAAATESRQLLEERRVQSKSQVERARELENAARKAQQDRDQADRLLTQLRSRLQSLEELAAAHEGFADGPKAALDWAKSGGYGERVRALADVLEVAKGYEAVIEGWLEGRLEGLVAEDPALAVRMLDSLRDQKQGRATVKIHPSQAVKSTDYNAVKGLLESGGFEVLGELAKYVTPTADAGGLAREAVSQSVANVCVVRSLAPIAQFVAGGHFARLAGWSVVAMDGSVLEAHGALKGGSLQADGSATILLRKRTIAELQEEVAAAEAVLAEAVALLDLARTGLEDARVREQELRTEVQSLEVQSAGLDRDVHQMSRAVKEADSQLELAELDSAEMKDEAEKARMQRQDAETEIVEVNERQERLSAEIASGENELSTFETQLRSEDDELQTLRIAEAGLRERVQSAKRELESGRAMVRDRENRLAEVVRFLDRASREKDQFSGGDEEIEIKIQELIVALAEGRERLSTVKDRLEQSNAKLNTALARIKELHESGDSKTSESNSVALDIERQNGDIAHLIQDLEQKYGAGCLDAPEVQSEMQDPVVTVEMTAEEAQVLQEEVERLRERIRRLGEVNPMADEEYDAMKKRFDHLVSEKADLERSMQNLQDAIDHINKTSEERFKRAFEAIADRFEKLFPVIFGGGQANLSLVYPEGSSDILEAGVDILAQPPGKKVVNINLLSGGEKALTAVSMIFAIFMVKPSPFCILDEVDAPLDDANIGKFNALLREMSAKSQFILITHNKRTMELNDTLYGVTMEEPGVSKMVSIEMH